MARIESIEYSHRFLKEMSRLPKRIIDEAQKKELIFRANPFDPRLRTHKLHGKEKELWAFWINHRYRIKFFFATDTLVVFVEVGLHDIYE